LIGIEIDGEGNLLLSGTVNAATLPEASVIGTRGWGDAFIAKFDPSGEQLLWATIIAGTEIQPDDSCGGLDHHPFDRLLHGLGTTSSGESRRQAVISHAPIHKLASVSLFKPEHLSQFPETAGLSSWCPVCS
jgi:hypothetical protein